MAVYRSILILLTVWLLASGSNALAAPEITQPSAGSTLSSSAQTFTWSLNDVDAVEVDQWWLYVGTSIGARDIANSGDLGKDTEYDVIGMPTDGSIVHTRLWYHTAADGWQSEDYEYITSDGSTDGGDDGGSDGGDGPIYSNDFSTETDGNRIHQFVSYRDPFVITHVTGSSDHLSTGGINCSAPEETRTQTRGNPSAHVYQCLPGGDPASGHQMSYAMDTSGYGFVGALPDQVFEGVREISVDINTTSAGDRNFIEIKVIPADQVYVNAMPCIPALPCNDGWDYNDIGAFGAATISQEGTGLTIATPDQPDGYKYDLYNGEQLANGDYQHAQCSGSGFCFSVRTHLGNIGIRERYTHVFRDNGDGTLSFGIEQTDNTFTWVEAPGSFPQGAVRVVIAFHNYTGTKSGNGPGFDSNLSPSTGGFTWHWDNLSVEANTSTSALDYYGDISADQIVTPNDCIAFSQGQRGQSHNGDILPRLHCNGDDVL